MLVADTRSTESQNKWKNQTYLSNLIYHSLAAVHPVACLCEDVLSRQWHICLSRQSFKPRIKLKQVTSGCEGKGSICWNFGIAKYLQCAGKMFCHPLWKETVNCSDMVQRLSQLNLYKLNAMTTTYKLNTVAALQHFCIVKQSMSAANIVPWCWFNSLSLWCWHMG